MTLPDHISQGQGDTAVFLLHGVGGAKEAWLTTMTALAGAGMRAVAWDMPGYGTSATLSPYNLHGLALALESLIDHIGARRNVLLGHSMGGMVAQEAVALYPAKVHGLLLCATSPAFGRAASASSLKTRAAPTCSLTSVTSRAPDSRRCWKTSALNSKSSKARRACKQRTSSRCKPGAQALHKNRGNPAVFLRLPF